MTVVTVVPGPQVVMTEQTVVDTVLVVEAPVGTKYERLSVHIETAEAEHEELDV